MNENNKKQRPKKKAFLAAYRACGNVTAAAKAAEVDRTSHYRWLRDDADYPAMFDDAESEAIERMEGEADRRALEGVAEPVFYEGEVCGHKQRYSDTLLIFRLKALRPEKYRERAEIAVDDSMPVRVKERIVAERVDAISSGNGNGNGRSGDDAAPGAGRLSG